MIIKENSYLEHYGKKGMRWGKRKARKEAAKKEYAKQQKQFMDTVMKDIKSRSPSELYAIKGTHGNIITTGEDFIDRVNMGMKFTQMVSTGQKINDGR